jgi:hypothetical protein
LLKILGAFLLFSALLGAGVALLIGGVFLLSSGQWLFGLGCLALLGAWGWLVASGQLGQPPGTV